MNSAIVNDEKVNPFPSDANSAAVIFASSTNGFDRIYELLKTLGLDIVQAGDSVEILKRYVQNDPSLIVIDNHLQGMSSADFLDQIVQMSVFKTRQSKVLVVCDDNNRDTVISIMKPVKASKGTLKLGMLVTPWTVADFYRQIINLHPDDVNIKFQVEQSLASFRNKEIESLNETRLFLGVSEIGQGLKIELGNDRVLSATSDTIDDYVEKIEMALLSTSVEYVQFNLEAMSDMLPSNVVALMMLINGFSSKHKKEILFTGISAKLESLVESYGLTEVLPLEHDVDLF